MGALEEFFEEDQQDTQSNNTIAHRQLFYWRRNTPQASKCLLKIHPLRANKAVVIADDLPDSFFTVCDDFPYLLETVSAYFGLNKAQTAWFEPCWEGKGYYYQLFQTIGKTNWRVINEADLQSLLNNERIEEVNGSRKI
ncbi:hypothetical protein [Coleofasciculus sp.]|uniref:hypothetical protein n=1 Tax=Coleofasciculus sp. TaxID=3100458 RepID=UPI0039F9B3D6